MPPRRPALGYSALATCCLISSKNPHTSTATVARARRQPLVSARACVSPFSAILQQDSTLPLATIDLNLVLFFYSAL